MASSVSRIGGILSTRQLIFQCCVNVPASILSWWLLSDSSDVYNDKRLSLYFSSGHRSSFSVLSFAIVTKLFIISKIFLLGVHYNVKGQMVSVKNRGCFGQSHPAIHAEFFGKMLQTCWCLKNCSCSNGITNSIVIEHALLEPAPAAINSLLLGYISLSSGSHRCFFKSGNLTHNILLFTS